ncbi:hypothetical protein AK830_g9176 [Neonectria ditissima]|uniref:Uncharacterized protein n=1 Tax=Neonectria ditissima TaxID=78410 RepID=A0A0P7B685_9HYPO|nr:hypothetical protein AK830_g9176 [Neonectria ditissima]
MRRPQPLELMLVPQAAGEMQESTLILVTDSWPLSSANAARGNEPHPLTQHPPKASIQAKARFDAAQNLISDKVAFRLLDSLDPGSSPYVQFIAIRWRGCVSDQTLEETHLKVVPNMECNSILLRASLSDYPEGKFSQQWLCLTTLNPLGTGFDSISSKSEHEHEPGTQSDNDASAFRITGLDQDPTRYEELPTLSKDEENYTSQDFRQFTSDAARHGFHFMNMETIEALAPLWTQTEPDFQLTYLTSSALGRDSDEIRVPYSDGYVWGSTADAYGQSDQEWSTGTSQTLCAAFPERLLTCDSTQASSELSFGTFNNGDWPPIYELSMEDVSLGASTLASGSSGDPASDQTIPPYQDQNEDFAYSPTFSQDQPNEFDSHPGHKVWEWVPERQRWRRRGGTKEADWFPDFFA